MGRGRAEDAAVAPGRRVDPQGAGTRHLCKRQSPAVGTLGRATFRRHQVPEAREMPRNPGLRCHWPLRGKQHSRPGDSAAPAAGRSS